MLPRVTADELMCLQPDVFRRVYDRGRLCRDYAETLETIIDGTKAPEGQSNGR